MGSRNLQDVLLKQRQPLVWHGPEAHMVYCVPLVVVGSLETKIPRLAANAPVLYAVEHRNIFHARLISEEPNERPKAGSLETNNDLLLLLSCPVKVQRPLVQSITDLAGKREQNAHAVQYLALECQSSSWSRSSSLTSPASE